MSADDDPPRLTEGPLADLLRAARHDAPRDDERAALDASLRVALRPTSLLVLSRWSWALGLVGAVAVATWGLVRLLRAPLRVQSTPRLVLAGAVSPARPSDGSTSQLAYVPVVDAGGVCDGAAPSPSLRCVSGRHVAAVGEARAALRARDFASALAITTHDRQRCPRGPLREERDRITVEALAGQGRRAEAVRALVAFERVYPTSLHLRALRALVDTVAPGRLSSTP